MQNHTPERMGTAGPTHRNYTFPRYLVLRHKWPMAPATIFPANPLPPLTDDEWVLIRAMIDRRSKKGGRPCVNCRRNIEGMRWVASTGKPWVDMPPQFGSAAAVRRYYARLKQRGVIDQLLSAFPKREPKDHSTNHARLTAGVQLECLRHLTERRARGRAARAQTDQI